MQKKMIQEVYKDLINNLTDRNFLKNMKMSKKSMMEILHLDDWKENISKVISDDQITCEEILSVCEKTLDYLSVAPKVGWLKYIYYNTVSVLFPDNSSMKTIPACEPGRLFYLEVLRTFLIYEKSVLPFNPRLHMTLLTKEERLNSAFSSEYNRFLSIMKRDYVYEFMRIGSEITPFNTLGHICGVHFVAMHVGRQLKKANTTIDLGLLSGAAAGHDIGKYGCKPAEAARIPYLHYYYTDKYFKVNDMPGIGHIATNHSTWDLELENLSVESLILIYSDFRVKSTRNPQGEEIVNFYSLKDSFDVILNKLDNVDEVKKDRYIRVYSKLKDFEDYMVSLGINTDLESSVQGEEWKKDSSLLNPEEVVQTIKNLAIKHNISLMSKLNSEVSFGNILEAARSEKNWKNIRAYINIFQEYFTYITQKQKIMTMNFLYELLMHREGDIRRQAADLLGNIIVHYDEEYRKEIPEGAKREDDELTSIDLWRKYLDNIILPDHKVTDQHKRWIGYTLKLIVSSVLSRCKEEEKRRYLDEVLIYFKDSNRDDSTAFILLDTMLEIPLSMCSEADLITLTSFALALSAKEPLEIQIAALRFIKYLSENTKDQKDCIAISLRVLENIKRYDVLSVDYLAYKIRSNLGQEIAYKEDIEKRIYMDAKAVSEIFLENLKAATPWVIKAVNIELLLEQINLGYNNQVLHVAAHFSNLIKVSERVTVRHSAGRALAAMASRLTLDQRNEVVIELTKGLEIGEYEFSKYIPEYLGQLALFLHPNELDEFLSDLKKLLESSNDRVGSVTLNTLGVLIQKYPLYAERFIEREEAYQKRRGVILGMILKGLANYRDAVSQEAFLVIGQYIFGSSELTLEDKYQVFQRIYKKMLTIITDITENELSFFNSAASLNHIYRFISDYIFLNGKIGIVEPTKAAFFPGTFDPFSLSHKGIVREIKNLGFEVYLALDEFSWSKKTQPRMIRRKIISMSVANEKDVYLFPDDIPVNIANPSDLERLRGFFPDKDIYIVVGSDVIANASSYNAPAKENSIHHFNHVIFKRSSLVEGNESDQNDGANESVGNRYSKVLADVIELSLPVHLEDISSTRIRENIDYNRDISNLIDPIAQNYIYDNSLYLREPQYKHILRAKAIRFEVITRITDTLIEELSETLLRDNVNRELIIAYLLRKNTKAVLIRDGENYNEIVSLSTFHQISMADLYDEFRDPNIAAYVRKNTSGKIIILSGVLTSRCSEIRNIEQLALTETLAYCLKNDYTYAIYHDYLEAKSQQMIKLLEKQGFLKVDGSREDNPVLSVDMKFPVTLFQNIETTIKEPFNRNERILKVIERAHENLQYAMTQLYPGNLVLSIQAGVMHYRLVDKITKENNVSNEPYPVRNLGKYMCVPFGKILRGMAVPNTVTKALHTEKVFEPEINKFKITEFPFYSPLINQIRTIKSFDRPVFLVDDLLHKGYRMKELDPIFKQEEVNISKLIVGILSGRGKDLMTIQGRRVESVYFIPNLRSWFVESSMYPFIGGDSVRRNDNGSRNASLISSVNLILPYVAPNFLVDAPKAALYNFSMTCLENARDILTVLEEEYQMTFERNLTLNRLSEAIITPRCPDMGICMSYDLNLPPSIYIANDIERLIRLKNVIL